MRGVFIDHDGSALIQGYFMILHDNRAFPFVDIYQFYILMKMHRYECGKGTLGYEYVIFNGIDCGIKDHIKIVNGLTIYFTYRLWIIGVFYNIPIRRLPVVGL